MRITSSTISMAASRNYAAEATENQITITRRYDGDEVASANASVATFKRSQYEVEGGTAVFQTSDAGLTRTDKFQVDHTHADSDPVEQEASRPQVFAVPQPHSQSQDWLSSFLEDAQERLESLKRFLEYLNWCTGRSHRLERPRSAAVRASGSSYKASASMVSMRYRETMAMIGSGQSGGGQIRLGDQGAVNGHWTRQTVQSGFVSGQENTAFRSKGTVVTSDGRTLDFNISMEMSRSFEAAYVVASKEEVYTDPLVINMDTDAPALSDVSFYFDLNCDGVAEELSGLDGSSGFLALDKNGDGEINNGSELFGAKTGDGFGELAQYDQDGNGWIDEGDAVFSRLSVWVKCGTGNAQLLSLSEADVGAIFLGSQNTQHTLMDSLGETGAMLRKTGVYLKESGQAGTIHHIDFKA